MFNKIKSFFSRPSKFDQLIFNELQETKQLIAMLDNHLIALARITLVTPDRLQKESINVQANTEYLQSLLKVKNAKSE
jgi:hypothetical protein